MPDPINWSLSGPWYALALAFGYLLGSIPFGLILTRFAGLGDIRSIGSGNIGTTNVLRTGRKDLAIATLALDALKGAAAVLIAAQWGPGAAAFAGIGAVIGHCFPVWLKFKGGKGVATFLGVVLALYWPLGLVFAAVWIYCAVFTRFSSFSALTGSLAVPLIAFVSGHIAAAEVTGLLALLIWAKHHENIRRLLKGEESRIGSK
ncbi:MAG: glycerol-3-phosphate 1-O-acyltransferase PlsY [Hyphomicrobiaceae bacterium]|nr:glycerol-3-phosphate 1-O-acyltransferase PlsY [Hyphomicrobiaceae bacterium]